MPRPLWASGDAAQRCCSRKTVLVSAERRCSGELARDVHLQSDPKTLASQQRDPGAPTTRLEKTWGYCSRFSTEVAAHPDRLCKAAAQGPRRAHPAALVLPGLELCHTKETRAAPLLQSSPNPGNSRKQLQRGALRKKEGWGKGCEDTQHQMRRHSFVGKTNSSDSLWSSLGLAGTGPSFQKQGLILHPSVATSQALSGVQD